MELGTWNLELGTWYLRLETWDRLPAPPKMDLLINYLHRLYLEAPGCYLSWPAVAMVAGTVLAAVSVRWAARLGVTPRKAAGLPGLHLNAVVWGRTILPGERTVADHFDSVADVIVHLEPLDDYQVGKTTEDQRSGLA